MTSIKIELAEEVRHLSLEQIEELYTKYLAGAKNSDLIEEYDISIKPNSLIKVLPPLIREDVLCPNCSLPMLQKRQSKSGIGTSSLKCFACEHKIAGNAYRGELCRCSYCTQGRAKLKLLEEEAKRIKEEQNRALILDIYSLDSREPIDYSILNFTQKLVLLTLFREHTDGEFDYILSITDTARVDRLCPTDSMTSDYINDLYVSHAIIVDPKSRISSFCEEKDFESFYPSRVQWVPNISIQDCGVRADLKTLHLEIYRELTSELNPEWADEIHELLYSIATEEVIQYLSVRAAELGFVFGAEHKARENINILLEHFSVSNIYYFAKKAVENAHIYFTKGYSKGKKHAGNTIPSKMLSLGERALNGKWDLYSFSRISSSPRSAISKVFFDLILRDENAGFTKAPGLHWQKDLSPILTQTDESILKSEGLADSLFCHECSSSEVEIVMNESQINLNCRACGTVQKFTADIVE
jgi:hypothetical protein